VNGEHCGWFGSDQLLRDFALGEFAAVSKSPKELVIILGNRSANHSLQFSDCLSLILSHTLLAERKFLGWSFIGGKLFANPQAARQVERTP
jgi:hypothetical protein